MEEPGGLPSLGSHACIGEGNGNPLQCSCLENPRDGGTWGAALYGFARSWTQLVLLLHGFAAKQACLVLWLSKPAFSSNH